MPKNASLVSYASVIRGAGAVRSDGPRGGGGLDHASQSSGLKKMPYFFSSRPYAGVPREGWKRNIGGCEEKMGKKDDPFGEKREP